METKPFINEAAFIKAQDKGRRRLHSMLLLLTFFLLGYMFVASIVVHTLFYEKAFVQFCIQAGIEIIIWMIAIFLLWNANTIGKIMFTICSLLSLYAIYYVYYMIQYPLAEQIDNIIRILFVFAYVCKSAIICLCMIRLYQRPIAYLWQSYAKEGKEAEIEDDILIQQIFEQNSKELQKKQSRKRIALRARHNQRMYMMLLMLVLYGGMLLFYFAAFIIRYNFANDGVGIDYAQRYVLLSSLFSALVFSPAAVFMFMYRKQARYALLAAWLCEIIRLCIGYSSTYEMFISQHYGMPSIIMLVLFEAIRYIVLIRLTYSYLRDPFISAFWKMKH